MCRGDQLNPQPKAVIHKFSTGFKIDKDVPLLEREIHYLLYDC